MIKEKRFRICNSKIGFSKKLKLSDILSSHSRVTIILIDQCDMT